MTKKITLGSKPGAKPVLLMLGLQTVDGAGRGRRLPRRGLPTQTQQPKIRQPHPGRTTSPSLSVGPIRPPEAACRSHPLHPHDARCPSRESTGTDGHGQIFLKFKEDFCLVPSKAARYAAAPCRCAKPVAPGKFGSFRHKTQHRMCPILLGTFDKAVCVWSVHKR